MHPETIREYCLSLPGVTEDVKWEQDLCFLIGNKMFAVQPLEGEFVVSFKCRPEAFAALCEHRHIKPAPYLARYHWVQLNSADALPEPELKQYLNEAYKLVREKLPKKVQATLPPA